VSDATERLSDSLDLYSPLVLADRLLGFLFQQPADSLRAGDVLVRPAVEGFTSLNFSPNTIDALIRRGGAAARLTLPRTPCLPRSPAPHTRMLPARVSGYSIFAHNPSERLALQRLLGLGLSDSLDVGLLRSRLRGMARAEAYQAVWLSPSGAGDSVSFTVSARASPRRLAGLGLAYDNELGGRMWVGAVDRRTMGLALEGSAALLLGELRKEISLGLRRNFQFGRQLMNPALTVLLANESIRRFDPDGHELNPAQTRDGLLFLGVERAFPAGWQGSVGGIGELWHEPQADGSSAGAALAIKKVTPSGSRIAGADFRWTGLYHRAAIDGGVVVGLGALRVQPSLRWGWGEDLPLQATFPLGGDDGFPGMHIGELRGDRESMASLLLTYSIRRPFVARAELASGRSATGGPALTTSGWIFGGRLGLGAETPVGPVRFEYGLASGGRNAFFVRLGQWF
jgi:hypothetical protein